MAIFDKKSFESVTGDPLMRYVWRPEGEVKGVVQLSHGMAEHVERYGGLAHGLCDAGYAFVGHNHLGHGDTARKQGYFADSEGWDMLLKDIRQVQLDTQKEFEGLPYFLLGHSMGSFLARCYIIEHGISLNGCILSGTGYYSRPMIEGGLFLSKLLILMGKGDQPAKIIDKVAFSGGNKQFAPNRTDYDWLSRDNAEVDKYINDNHSGFVFTARAFNDLFHGLKRLLNMNALAKMPKELPVYFLSGDKDPIGKNGEGVRHVAGDFLYVGMLDVEVKLYEGGRHEMFNEINRDEVNNDLIHWLDEHQKTLEPHPTED